MESGKNMGKPPYSILVGDPIGPAGGPSPGGPVPQEGTVNGLTPRNSTSLPKPAWPFPPSTGYDWTQKYVAFKWLSYELRPMLVLNATGGRPSDIQAFAVFVQESPWEKRSPSIRNHWYCAFAGSRTPIDRVEGLYYRIPASYEARWVVKGGVWVEKSFGGMGNPTMIQWSDY